MPSKNKNLSLAILCGVPLIMVLGNSMLIPILPKMKSILNVSQFQISLIITMFSVPAGIVIPFAGFLSDRVGRKIVISISLLIYALGGIVSGLAAVFLQEKAYTLILAGRIIQGIGAAGTAPIAMALSSDIFTGQGRGKALGLIEASNGMGKVLSPIFGSLLGLITWYAVFFAFPIVCIPIALATWFLVQEPSTKKQPKAVKEYFQSLKKIFQKRGRFLLANFWAGSVTLFILFGVLFYLSDLLEEKYKIEGVLKGGILAIPLLAMCTTSYLTGSKIKKKAGLMKLLVCIGLVLIAISTAIASFFENSYILTGTLVFTGIGAGLVLPCLNTMITSSCSMDERGMVTALYGSVRFFGVAIGPPVFGLLMEKGRFIMFGFVAVLALVTAGLEFFLVKKQDLQVVKQSGQSSNNSNKQSNNSSENSPNDQEIGTIGQNFYADNEPQKEKEAEPPKPLALRMIEIISGKNLWEFMFTSDIDDDSKK